MQFNLASASSGDIVCANSLAWNSGCPNGEPGGRLSLSLHAFSGQLSVVLC